MTTMPTQPAALPPLDPYGRFCRSVLAQTGLDLVQYRRQQMERRVNGFAQSAGCDSLPEYQELIERDAEALAAFLDRLTINVSQLWRNPGQWSVLETKLIGELGETGRLRALCAGVSYGAEAYTLAALCLRALANVDVKVDILGTDIDQRMIARAQQGAFSEEDARDAPADALEQYFERDREGGWRARDELRALVRFEVADLLRDTPAPESLDLILCRNTVIYFEPPVRDSVHARLASGLRRGGRLVVGSTELVSTSGDHGLVHELPFIYRKA